MPESKSADYADAVSKHIDRDALITTLVDAVRTPSVSTQEREVAEKLDALCRSFGLASRLDRHNNVIAMLPGRTPGRRLLLNTHIDTVKPNGPWTVDPYGGVIRDGRLCGVGANDTKSAAVAMIYAMKALKELDVPLTGEVLLTACMGEEIQNVEAKGTVKWIRDGGKADMAIVGEPSGLNACLGCEGMLDLEIVTRGRSAHASRPQDGVNAIHQMAKVVLGIHALTPRSHPLLGSGAISVGVISGGTQSSVVPAECRVRVGRFIVPGENMETFLAELQALFRRLKTGDEHFEATTNPTYASNAQIIDRDHAVVQGLERAMRVVMGSEPHEVGSQGHSDADFLQNLAGIPCVTFGPRGWGSHKEDEYVELDTVITAARVYAGAVIELLGT